MSSSSSDSCFVTSNSCPSSRVTSCSHSEDVTISCSKYNLHQHLIKILYQIPLTVNTMPHYTGNTLPNVVPQATPNSYVQYTTLPAQGGHSPSPYYYVPPTNAAFKNCQPTTHMPPPYSQVSHIWYQLELFLNNFVNSI